ncbi:hypothetical protein [Psychrobacter sp. JB385]|uniref:hypothetical protein n=1 Tax=Psychrobacter sp. JB385 TaxID=1434841 RepID=UPI000B36133F|nr:hypothetical protein [Psychrobacter sp. JB385]
MKTMVANFKLNLLSCSILITSLVLSGCNAQKPIPNLEIKNKKSMEINSECQFKSVFDDTIPGRISYFDYMGKTVKFEPDPDHFWQSIVVGCLNTDKGLIIIGLDRNHPAESVAQMTLATYLYEDNNLIPKKYLNQAWSCMPDHSRGDFLNTSNLTINIKCKEKKEDNENITSSFDQKFSVNIL